MGITMVGFKVICKKNIELQIKARLKFAHEHSKHGDEF